MPKEEKKDPLVCPFGSAAGQWEDVVCVPWNIGLDPERLMRTLAWAAEQPEQVRNVLRDLFCVCLTREGETDRSNARLRLGLLGRFFGKNKTAPCQHGVCMASALEAQELVWCLVTLESRWQWIEQQFRSRFPARNKGS